MKSTQVHLVKIGIIGVHCIKMTTVNASEFWPLVIFSSLLFLLLNNFLYEKLLK